jgi:hypothetical protein
MRCSLDQPSLYAQEHLHPEDSDMYAIFYYRKSALWKLSVHNYYIILSLPFAEGGDAETALCFLGTLPTLAHAYNKLKKALSSKHLKCMIVDVLVHVAI